MDRPEFHELGEGVGTAAPCWCFSGSSFPPGAGGAGISPAPARGKVTLRDFSGLWIINDLSKVMRCLWGRARCETLSLAEESDQDAQTLGFESLGGRGLNPEQPQIPGDPILAFPPSGS